MRSSFLSKVRIVISLAVLVITACIFLDISHLIPEKLIRSLLWLQFIPSANKYLAAGTAATGFVIVLVLTFLSGRTYCSFLCPLGIMQDVFNRLAGWFRKRYRKYGFRRPYNLLRYTILAVTLIFTLTAGIQLLLILDPYSVFARFMTCFGKPVVMLVNNLLSSLLGKAHIYMFVHSPLTAFPLTAYIIPFLFLLLVGFLSFTHGRLFCNTVCPVGTFLGLLSKISVLRIRFDRKSCSKCGRCSAACKSSCIDFQSMEVDLSRCVSCFNCLKSCPDKALEYSFFRISSGKGNLVIKTDTGKRKNIINVLMVIMGTGSYLSAQSKTAPVPKKSSTVREKRICAVSPPGSASIENYTRNCTACSLCISACPNNVLVPSYREFGIASIMQPHLNFRKGFCAYECTRCLEICPTGALMPLTLDAKKLTQIGKAVFIKENCIVNTEKTACGACSEACPTKAVHMVPFSGRLVIPETTDEICIGCGHCENACPTTPFKAIFINGNQVHKVAKKPANIKTELQKPEEFPF